MSSLITILVVKGLWGEINIILMGCTFVYVCAHLTLGFSSIMNSNHPGVGH